MISNHASTGPIFTSKDEKASHAAFLLQRCTALLADALTSATTALENNDGEYYHDPLPDRCDSVGRGDEGVLVLLSFVPGGEGVVVTYNHMTSSSSPPPLPSLSPLIHSHRSGGGRRRDTGPVTAAVIRSGQLPLVLTRLLPFLPRDGGGVGQDYAACAGDYGQNGHQGGSGGAGFG